MNHDSVGNGMNGPQSTGEVLPLPPTHHPRIITVGNYCCVIKSWSVSSPSPVKGYLSQVGQLSVF